MNSHVLLLTGDAASNFAAKQFDRYDNAKSRKQWREGVKATGEDLEQLTRRHLLEHPSLFQSNLTGQGDSCGDSLHRRGE